jgi:HEAT repeat protein
MAEAQSNAPVRNAKSGPSRVLVILAILGVVVPFMVWRGTWFGRVLTDQQIEEYLDDTEHPRKMQHALAQISDRIVEGDASAEKYYPRVSDLAQHDDRAIRATVAWVMGQDNNSDLFHDTLLKLLNDPEVMVRRNTALSLVRFSDPRGREELVQMLVPFEIQAPQDGTVAITLTLGQKVGHDALLARIVPSTGDEMELRAPFSGTVSRLHIADGSPAGQGDELLVLDPDSDQVWESLRGLYFVGQSDDLPLVARYQRGFADVPNHVREQATLTAQAIRTRSEPDPSR